MPENSGLRIRIDLMRIMDPDLAFFLIADLDPVFDDLKLNKIYSWKFNFYFLDQKLQFTYPYTSIKDAQATGEAFSTQKRTSNTSKHDNSVFFSIFVRHFCPPGSGSSCSAEINI
jgi:hypothetical protein